MRKNIPSLSVFFPAYNEEANLKTTIEHAVSILKMVATKWEILIVNDGSGDRTREVGEELSRRDMRIRVVNHRVNKGYGEALKTGFREAKYPWVAFADSDGQFDFSEIEKFLPHREDSDFILGYRLRRADPLIRSLGAWVWNITAKILLGLPARDYSCGFKLIKKEAYEKTLPLTAGEKVTQIEFLVKARRLGLRFAEVGVNHYPRRFGTQTGANIKVVVRSFIDLFKLWWTLLNKLEFFAVLIILTLAAFLRLYKIDQYMTFLGDEGRDAIVVRRLLVNLDPILIGPGTSIGNMYLGPLYYYMMAPAMFLAGLSPVGSAVQIALLGVITVWFIWKIAREWFGSVAGFVASSVYAISPIVVLHSHSSWNPNIMPFFALLSIYSIWRVWKHSELKWLVVLGVAYALVLQSHYLGLLLLPTLGLFWLLTLLKIRNWNWGPLWGVETGKFWKHTGIAIVIFLLLMSPLVIFDARHGWRNFEAMRLFFTQRQETVSLRPWIALPDMWPIWQEKFVTRFMTGMNEQVGTILAILLIVGILFVFAKKSIAPLLLILVWVMIGLLGLGVYKQEIYDHYFGFMFAAPFILLGAIAQQITNYKLQVVKILMVAGIIVIVTLNLMVTPISQPPQRQLQRTEEVAQKIADQSGGKSFNLAVLAERNYEDAYQYFLEWWREPVRDIDPLRYGETVADQLFVVCELPPEKCDPTHNPKAEITVFGWSKIEEEWDVAGFKVYKLVHNPSGKPQ